MAVAAGGALGSVLRFLLAALIDERMGGGRFPWGTLVVNVTGCLIIGFCAAATRPQGRLAWLAGAQPLVMTGVLGGYTTFSSFSLQTLTLSQHGEWIYAGGYAIGSMVLCLLAVWLGYALALLLDVAPSA
ncbi:fluoride efflux transporter CrcB [Verrucomicrobia bacterium LW23]|nr:fluoride efflux transporter CrcB [Verrucomicrobia bacterium LW23]